MTTEIDPTDELLTMPEAAALLDISRARIYQLVALKKLPTTLVKAGPKRWAKRIPRTACLNYKRGVAPHIKTPYEDQKPPGRRNKKRKKGAPKKNKNWVL